MKAMGSLPRRAMGAPLPRLLRTHFQRLFQASLHDVRLVVSDAPACLHARAFALGRTVHLAPALLRAGGPEQRRVLGHEIAHLLQQRMGATRRPLRAEPSVLEAEAARAGRRVAMGRAVTLRSRRRRRPAACVQRIKLAIRGTRDGDLDAARLLNLMDAALASRLADAAAHTVVEGTVTITQGGHWLSLLGRLAKGEAIVPFNERRASILPVAVQIGEHGWEMPAEARGSSERLHFPLGALRWADVTRIDTGNTALAKVDLNYQQIADGFRKLNNSGCSDANVADNMLLLMKALPLGRNFSGEKQPNVDRRAFIEAIVALMFGVEASRFPSAFVTSLMLLDLVRSAKCYGRGGDKRFTLKGSFDKPGTKFDFDCLYGGKFPCAVHEPGKGNAANRRMLGQLGGQRDDAKSGHLTRADGMQMMMELNHRFVVPRREVTLMIHWIEANTQNLASLTCAGIQRLIETRIDAATSGDAELPPTLPFDPRRDTGMHSADVPGQRTQVRVGTTVYYQQYEQPPKRNQASRQNQGQPTRPPARIEKIGRYYHTLDNCKLFGGRTDASRQTLTASYRQQDQAAVPLPARMVREQVTQKDLNAVRQFLCPHCAS
jgi:hypothetical protein